MILNKNVLTTLGNFPYLEINKILMELLPSILRHQGVRIETSKRKCSQISQLLLLKYSRMFIFDHFEKL